MTASKLRAVLVFVATMITSNIIYATEIACDIEVSDSQLGLFIKPSNDIYAFSKLDTPGDFRLSGQYLPNLNKLKIYVYHKIKNKYVLISAQEYSDVAKNCPRDFGINRIYGGSYEIEFFFKCYQTCTN